MSARERIILPNLIMDEEKKFNICDDVVDIFDKNHLSYDDALDVLCMVTASICVGSGSAQKNIEMVVKRIGFYVLLGQNYETENEN